MEKNKNTSISSSFLEILKKNKSLKKDTVYPYKILGKPSDKLRMYISRMADGSRAKSKLRKPIIKVNLQMRLFVPLKLNFVK